MASKMWWSSAWAPMPPPLPSPSSSATETEQSRRGQPTPRALVPANPMGLLVADLNNDGKQDVVVISLGTYASPATVAVFLGNGDGTVTPGATYAAGFGARKPDGPPGSGPQ